MPIVDGITATKTIREIELGAGKGSTKDESDRSNRIPIFAVSASIVESEVSSYIGSGFDGWIMKPINFARLKIILEGVLDPKARKEPSGDRDWETGGWFQVK